MYIHSVLPDDEEPIEPLEESIRATEQEGTFKWRATGEHPSVVIRQGDEKIIGANSSGFERVSSTHQEQEPEDPLADLLDKNK